MLSNTCAIGNCGMGQILISLIKIQFGLNGKLIIPNEINFMQRLSKLNKSPKKSDVKPRLPR